MKSALCLFAILLFTTLSAQQDLVRYVKPIIGTEKMGHTYPGATVPFGAVQLSPETDTISYELNGKYNGEVYNYRELRAELMQEGFSFHTESDTEVLLNSYKEWGKDCLSHFNGMWSFVIFDKKKQILFGARDRFGVKPLYYYSKSDYFVFASEPKAIVALPFVSSSLDSNSLSFSV